jgi:hypothetical protein
MRKKTQKESLAYQDVARPSLSQVTAPSPQGRQVADAVEQNVTFSEAYASEIRSELTRVGVRGVGAGSSENAGQGRSVEVGGGFVGVGSASGKGRVSLLVRIWEAMNGSPGGGDGSLGASESSRIRAGSAGRSSYGKGCQ